MSKSDFIYLSISPADIGMFRFLLEARDNLAISSTVDKQEGILKVRFARESREEVENALRCIGRTLHFKFMPFCQP